MPTSVFLCCSRLIIVQFRVTAAPNTVVSPIRQPAAAVTLCGRLDGLDNSRKLYGLQCCFSKCTNGWMGTIRGDSCGTC